MSLPQELIDYMDSEEYQLDFDICCVELFIRTGEGGGEYEWLSTEPGQEKTAREIAIHEVAGMKKRLEQLKAAA